jgi:shikimate dehydrogenase
VELTSAKIPNKSALILGTGGASEAVSAVLGDLNITAQFVSRSKGNNIVTYQELDESTIAKHLLIINTTPLGTFPNIDEKPEIPYQFLTKNHYLFDLVYNPAETAYLKEGVFKWAKTKNGLEMLEQQAEEAWRIWNS